MLPSDFLAAVFSGVTEGVTPITSLTDNRSENQKTKTTWFAFDSPDWSLADAMVESQKASLFWHPGVRHSVAPGNGRGSAKDVAGIVCVWLDIDLAAKVSKKRYPSRVMALETLDKLSVPASIVVETGGGLHAYWLLDGLLEPVEGAQLVKDWEQHFESRLPAGYVIDHVSNVDRMMRLPGSFNLKYQPANRVDILGNAGTHEWVRYSARALKIAAPARSNGHSNGHGGLDSDDWDASASGATAVKTMKPNSRTSEMIQVHVQNLLDCDPEFEKIWNHKKNITDTSQSGWDLEICRYLARGSEFCDKYFAKQFCLENRRLYDDNPTKADRVDYVQNTWSYALKLESDRGIIPPAPAVAYMGHYELLTDYFGPEVNEVVKYGADDTGEYVVRFAGDKELALGTVDQWSTQSRMRNIVLGRLGGRHNPMNKLKWEEFCHAIVDLATVVHADELSFVREIAAYVQEHTGDISDLCDDTRATQIGMGRPVIMAHGLGISLDSLMKHINLHEKRAPSRPKVIRALEACGFTGKQIKGSTGNSAQKNKKVVVRRYWFVDPLVLETVVSGEIKDELEEQVSR